jgi:hypothetical protein
MNNHRIILLAKNLIKVNKKIKILRIYAFQKIYKMNNKDHKENTDTLNKINLDRSLNMMGIKVS